MSDSIPAGSFDYLINMLNKQVLPILDGRAASNLELLALKQNKAIWSQDFDSAIAIRDERKAYEALMDPRTVVEKLKKVMQDLRVLEEVQGV